MLLKIADRGYSFSMQACDGPQCQEIITERSVQKYEDLIESGMK